MSPSEKGKETYHPRRWDHYAHIMYGEFTHLDCPVHYTDYLTESPVLLEL